MFPSTTARMQEEIKRLQQLQRLRAATAVCNFPSATGAANSGGAAAAASSGLSHELAGLSSMNNNFMARVAGGAG